jgi:hypothetical protein
MMPQAYIPSSRFMFSMKPLGKQKGLKEIGGDLGKQNC